MRLLKKTLPRHLVLLALGVVGVVVLTGAVGDYQAYQLAQLGAYLCAAAGLTVLTGSNGQVSLGHAALMAIGAYTVAVLQTRFSDAAVTGQWVLPVSLLAAVVVSTVAGAVFGVAAARLRGPYLAGATLALGVALPGITSHYSGFFKGDQGLSVFLPPVPDSLGVDFPLERWQAWITCLGALIVYVLLANLMRSRYGRAFRAVRDDEVAAELAGLHVARVQVLAFVVSAACAGLGGGLFVVVTQLAAPGAFALTLSVALLAAVVLGGLGSLWGAALGSAAIVLIPQWSDDLSKSLSLSSNVQANLALAVYGALLIGVMLAAPRGLAGAFDWVHQQVRRASTRREEEEQA